MPNARVQRGRERQSDDDVKLASRPPLQRLVRLRLGRQTCLGGGTLGKGAYHQFPV
jgi:hypothetical protein